MKRLIALLFLLASPAFATTTVTGTIQTLGTGTVSTGAFARFWLRGCGGNQPRVNGTAVIAPSQGGVFYFDFTANSSGQISGTLYSTRDVTGNSGGDIECGGSLTAVWYGLQIFLNGKGGPEIPIQAKNTTTIDVSNVTPITTNPVVTAPTGDTTYARIDGGNTPFTSPIRFVGGSRLFSNPLFGTATGVTPYEFSDSSADSSDAAAQLNSHFLPYLSVNLQSQGAGQPIPGYFSIDNRSILQSHTLNTGANTASLAAWCDIGFGGRAAGCWGHNIGVSLQAGYTISSISNNGTTTTAIVTVPGGFTSLALQNGDDIMVQGVTITGYDGRFVVASVTPGTGTVTWAQTASLSASSGGTVTLDANIFGLEVNYFNAIGDSGNPSPQTTRAKWGIVSTASGSTYPIMAGFLETFSSASWANSTNGNRPHFGYFGQDAIDAIYRAGDISSTAPVAGGPLIATHGFYGSARQVATNSNNYPGLDFCSEISGWTGSSAAAHTACINAIPASGNNPLWRMGFLFDNVEESSIDNTGHLAVNTCSGCTLVASLTTTGATSDNVAISGMTSSGHCSFGATNASAATNIATTYISSKTTNQITVTHTATASMTYDILCTPN